MNNYFDDVYFSNSREESFHNLYIFSLSTFSLLFRCILDIQIGNFNESNNRQTSAMINEPLVSLAAQI